MAVYVVYVNFCGYITSMMASFLWPWYCHFAMRMTTYLI